MKQALLILLLLSAATHKLAAQGENNIWYFGYNGGLNFNSGTPVVITNGQTSSREGIATVSNASGSILFYTDGNTVWNSNHAPMPNGFGLAGNGSSTQSATIVSMPGSSTHYYIFTTSANEQNNLPGFCYSVVDMTLNGGLGDVITKNTLLHATSAEKCVAIYSSTSNDVWVIAANTDSIFYAYPVTSTGVGTPVVSYHQPYLNSYGFNIGYLKASPQGNRLATALYSTTISENILILFDFNCSTGIISNEIVIPTTYTLYGLEFSPNGSLLYVFPFTSTTPIYQYNCALPSGVAMDSSKQIIGSSLSDYPGAGQIGPDQKIYITYDFGDWLSIISNPDLPGTACNFIGNGIYMPGMTSLGLPGAIRGNVCGTTGLSESTPAILQAVFPNPANDQLTLNVNTAISSIEIFDMPGQKVMQVDYAANSKQITLDVKSLSKGIYVLLLNKRQAKKFVKQ